MITVLFALVLIAVWALTRERADHSPTLGAVAIEWAKCLVSRGDDDGDDDGDDEIGDDDDTDDDGVERTDWGAVGAPEPERHQTVIGLLPAPKRPQPERLAEWQEWVFDARRKGHTLVDIKKSVERLYRVSPRSVDRFVAKAKQEGQW